MYKALVGSPLQQTMVLIWCVGMGQMIVSLGNGVPGIPWVLTALLAGSALTLIAGRFRRPGLLPLVVVIGLGALLTCVYHLGVTGQVALATATGLYGLLLWRGVIHALTLPLTARLVALLDLRGGYPGAGGRLGVERYVHGSGLALVLLSLLAGMEFDGSGAMPVVAWPVFIVSLAFLWLAGARYQRSSHRYLFIVVGAWGILGLYSQFVAHRDGIPLQHAGVALMVAILSVLGVALARWLRYRSLAGTDGCAAAEGLWVRPLERSSLLSAALAIVHVGALVLAGYISGPGWTGALALALAASTLMATDRPPAQPLIVLLGALLTTLSLSWFFSAAKYAALPFGLWPGGPAAADQWLLLGVMAVFLASLGQGLTPRRGHAAIYVQPLLSSASLVWVWTLLGVVAMFLRGQPGAAWVIIVLAGCLFPLLRGFDRGAALRGIALALLSCLWFAAVFGVDRLSDSGWLAGILWGYALWAVGNLGLPRFNHRCPQWSVAPETWPWIGLMLLGAGLMMALAASDPPRAAPWLLSLCVSVYLFLMLRNSAWKGFIWLGALALLLVGLLFGVNHHLNGLSARNPGAVGALALETLLVANLFMLALPLWRRYGDAISARLGLLETGLCTPLLSLSMVVCTLWLAALGAWDAALIITPDALPGGREPAVALGVLLTASLLHALVRWRSALSGHLLVAAVFFTLVAAWGAVRPFGLPLLLALWSALVALAGLGALNPREMMRPVSAALRPWVYLGPAASLASLALIDSISTGGRLLTVGVLAGVATVLGLGRNSRGWFYAATALIVVLLHGVWLPRADALGLLPWYALQSALLAWGLSWLVKTLTKGEDSGGDRARMLREVARKTAPWLAGIALLEWLLNLVVLTMDLMLARSPQIVGGGLGVGAAFAAAAVLIVLSIGRATVRRHEIWVYAVAFLVAMTGVYGRLLWRGLAPLGVWDTAAIVVAGYALFVVQRLTGSGAILKLLLLLPFLAAATVPFQLASVHAGLALLAIGTLCLLTRYATGLGTPLYLGLLALNAAIYLWVPTWAEHSGLLQVYLVPAALSVLFLLHLHRRELRGKVVNSARLAALSTFYAAVTVDVFIQEQLSVFVLALALSVSGILVGIALRTRGFLYAGTIFLVMNVMGQLLQLYPDQRLGRALVLMALGAGITGAMIWFNLKREMIMARIRVFRADLETWD